MTTVALSSSWITGEWAEYSASLPEKTKWKAEAYLLSKICRSLHVWREETASEQIEHCFFLSIAISERKKQNKQKEIKRGTNLNIAVYSPDRKSERIHSYESHSKLRA